MDRERAPRGARHAGRRLTDAGAARTGALEARAEVLAMTERAEAAVLAPANPGAWSHALRAALAARIAAHHGLADEAARYADGAGSDPAAVLAEPAEDGTALNLAAVVAFVDRVALAPREATATDVAGLRAAGVADADIVRLAELVAFLAYRFRLTAGLRLLTGSAA